MAMDKRKRTNEEVTDFPDQKRIKTTEEMPEPGYLEVEMEYYLFVKKKIVPSNLAGFYTYNVCECLCGFISSEKGYAFFHFFKRQDAGHLINLIERDVSDSEALNIFLVGGNPKSIGILKHLFSVFQKYHFSNLSKNPFFFINKQAIFMNKFPLIPENTLFLCLILAHL